MKDATSVGLGEMAISRNPEDVLVAFGLGSCMGVIMLDPLTHISGLLHAVLPRAADGMEGADVNPFKYVESGIEALLTAMTKEGANRTRITVRLAGGANMLMSAGMTRAFDIGTRNIESARTTLARLRMPVVTADVGGHTGRTVRVYVAESRVTVRVIGEKERDL